MNRPQKQLTPDRLCDAASVVLQAVSEFAATHGQQRPYPPSLVGGPAQPSCLTGFERWEVEQATQFLIRLGFLEHSSRTGR